MKKKKARRRHEAGTCGRRCPVKVRKGLTHGEVRRVAAFGRHLLDSVLQLRDWTLSVAHEACVQDPEDAGRFRTNAVVVVHEPSRHATIFLAEHWSEIDRVDRDRVIVHELCHLVTERHADLTASLITALPEEARSGLQEALSAANEFSVHTIEQIVVNLLERLEE